MLILLGLIFSFVLVLLFYLFITKIWWALILIFFGAILIYIMLFLSSAYLITLLFPIERKKKDNIVRRKKPYKIYKYYTRYACQFVRQIARIKIVNQTKGLIPKNKPFLLVCNHQSLVDPILVIDSLKMGNLYFLMKQEIRKIPIAGRWLHHAGFYYLNRSNNRDGIKTILLAINDLKNGSSVGVFIEGTRSKGPELGEFHEATLKMALKTNVPVVVCCVDDCYKISKNYPKKSKVLVKVCQVIESEKYTGMTTSQLSDYIKSIMEKSLAEYRNK